MVSKTYCAYLWEHVCLGEDNKLKPCCRFIPDEEVLEDFTSDLVSSLNSQTFQDLRSKALQGQKISGCNSCYLNEESNTPSLRQLANKNSKQVHDNTKITDLKSIQTMELFLGDTCNLKCVMCQPSLSTKWREDYKQLGWEMKPRTKLEINSILREGSSMENLRHVKFVGGRTPFVTCSFKNSHAAAIQQ